MKKLMIAAAIVCAAVVSQAASIKWQSGQDIKPDGENVAGSKTLSIYAFYLANETAYNNLSLDSIWETYGNETISDMAVAANANGKASSAGDGTMGVTASYTVQDADKGKTFYSAIIVAWDSDKDGKVDKYAVNKAYAEVNSGGSVVTQPKDLGLTIFGSDPAQAVTWQSVPEPTSGLLLLLGVAGLALRRRA